MSTPQRPFMPQVSVNGHVIAATEIASEAQHHTAPDGKPGLAWRAAARALVVRRLLLEEARRRKLSPDPQEIANGKIETSDEALIRALLDQSILPQEVSQGDIRAAYDDPATTPRGPDLYQPAHILIAARPGDRDARAAAREKAQAVFRSVSDRPDSFAQIAKSTSDCPSKNDGGNLGQVSRGDTVPEFEAALKDLKAGALYPEPLETRYGFHILFMHERADGQVLPYASAAPRLRQALEKRAWVAASRRFTAELIQRADISGVDFDL